MISVPVVPLHNEKELLGQVARGDEEAFRKIFHLYWDNIYGVSLMLTRSEAMAEDMLQDIFLKIWNKREKLVEVEHFSNYLFILARNHILTELKRLAVHIPFQDELIRYFQDGARSPEQQLLDKESKKILQQAVEHLPGQQRVVYLLSREQGLSQDQIADRLAISKNTVRNHMARALQSIRKYLEDHTDGLLLLICLLNAFLPLS